MGRFYIINAPWGFSTAWTLIKGWLDEATVAKIHILGHDYKKELLQQIPAESLPAFLGGSCFCGQGCQLSDAGPWQGQPRKSSIVPVEDVPAPKDVVAPVVESDTKAIESALADVSIDASTTKGVDGVAVNGTVATA
jgi:hypothetical protein